MEEELVSLKDGVVTNVSKTTPNKNNSSFFLLFLLVVAALSIVGIAVYSYTNNPKKSEVVTTSKTVTSEPLQHYSFTDGRLRLEYKLPMQASYGERNATLFGVHCFEETEDCLSLEFISAQAPEWIVTQNDVTKIYDLDTESKSITFSLVPYRTSISRYLGCDELCDTRALISVHLIDTQLTLDEAVEQMNEARAELYEASGTLDLTIKVVEKLTKWNTLAYKLDIPEVYETGLIQDTYLARDGENFYYIQVLTTSEDLQEKVDEVLNSFKFIK